MGWKRVIAIALLILGGYYLLTAVGIIPSEVSFGNLYPNPKPKGLAILAVMIIIAGLLLDDVWRRKIKRAFS